MVVAEETGAGIWLGVWGGAGAASGEPHMTICLGKKDTYATAKPRKLKKQCFES